MRGKLWVDADVGVSFPCPEFDCKSTLFGKICWPTGSMTTCSIDIDVHFDYNIVDIEVSNKKVEFGFELVTFKYDLETKKTDLDWL